MRGLRNKCYNPAPNNDDGRGSKLIIPEKHYDEAAEAVRQRSSQQPRVGLILGSGLGTFVDNFENPDVIPYQEIPNWPQSTVQGHAGQLVIGKLGEHVLIAMQGRIHFYEGYSMSQVTLPVRVMQRLGIHTLVITNAAGGLNPDYIPGDIMVIEDHIFPAGMAGHNPLIGPNLDSFGPRFSIHTRNYDPTLRALAHRVAKENNLALREGVYAALSGPTFETPAEVRMLRAWGADAVGMSTAPEALVAYHAGMRVLGFSTITNASLDSTTATDEVSHESVLEIGRRVVPRLSTILQGVLANMPPYNANEMENAPK